MTDERRAVTHFGARVSAVLAMLIALTAGIAPAARGEPRTENFTDREFRFDIPAQALSSAILSFSAQTGVQIITDGADVSALKTNGVSGQLSISQALVRLLSGTGLQHRAVGKTAVALTRSGQPSASAAESMRPTSSVHLAQVDSSGRRSATSDIVTDERRLETQRVELEEIVVTGTHLRGPRNTASPISVHTRDDIDRSGAGSIERFIQTLPENFKGGASEGTVGTLAGGSGNLTRGTGVNLRGLGPSSTLVLLNGRRLAPGDSNGSFVDVSLIPLAAVERVEVVTDGSSAIYGADAVGGVVNFIMRKDFEGAETRARYGRVTEGSLRELQIGQTVGVGWEGGRALASYEYLEQQPLDVSDKSWIRPPSAGRFDLLTDKKRHGAYVSLEHGAADAWELFADALYSERSTIDYFTTRVSERDNRAHVDNLSVAGGARLHLPKGHELELALSHGESQTEIEVLNMLAGGTRLLHQDATTSIQALDANIGGTLVALGSGAVSYAVGAHGRRETYENANLLTNSPAFENDRRVWAGFVEVRVPLVGPAANARDPQLELTLAGRYENYSDFGSATHPRIGLVWTPSSAVRLRGTWGTSFRAPLLADLNPVPSQVAAVMRFDPQAVPPGNRPVVSVSGGNPDLTPEEAESWTVGVDWTPARLPGLTARATYYDISYTDRIVTFSAGSVGVALTDVLRFEHITAPFITRNPTVGQLQALIASVAQLDDFTGLPGGVNLEDVVAIHDSRALNLARDETSGIDAGLSYTWTFDSSSLAMGIDGTYVLKLDKQFAPTVPVVHAVDTIFNPADLKLRARAAFQKGGFDAALYVNHVDSYTDTRGGAQIPVDSWTTLDANLGYRFGEDSGLWSGVSVSIGAINLTDRPPPFVAPTSTTFDVAVFDGANADVRGRFVYANVAKRF